MVALVTLEEVHDALKPDGTEDDAWLSMLILACSEKVIEYLKDGADGFLDESGDPIPDDVPERVKLATIVLVGYFYRNPDADPDKDFQLGYLPMPVMSMLYGMRDPALA